MDSQHLGH